MRSLLESFGLEEMSEYMGYGKTLIIVFLVAVLITFLVYKLFTDQRWVKYTPGFALLIFGLFSLTRIDISAENFLDDNSLVGFVIGVAGGFATLLFGLILGIYHKPRKKKKKRANDNKR